MIPNYTPLTLILSSQKRGWGEGENLGQTHLFNLP
jgi:hypothetical protein